MPGSNPTEVDGRRHAFARSLFSPTSIALMGASADASKLTSRPLRLLRRHGYPGSIVHVGQTPMQGSGIQSYRTLAEVPEQIEHAFIMLPAASVAAAVAECAAAGVKVATIFSSGFAELGAAGKRRQDLITATARSKDLRLIGPSSLGVVSSFGRMALSTNAVFEHERLQPGPLSLVSQSGSMLGAILTRAQERGLGFSKLVSVGNECDVKVGELVHLLVDDPDTGAILLFLESLRDAPMLAAAARRAFDARKPVIALKLGRSPLGHQVSASHTGTIAGADAAADAFFRDIGILRVSVFEALFETAQLVLGHAPPTARRVGAVTVSGGAAALVIDRLGMANLELAPPSAGMVDKLRARGIRIGAAPLIDLPMGRADGATFPAILDELIASDHCDIVLAVQGSNAAHEPVSVRERILAARRGGKPLAVFVGPRADEALRVLQDHGVAGFRTPESCADAIRAYCDWKVPAVGARVSADDESAARIAVPRAASGLLDPSASLALMQRLGIPCAASRVVQDASEPLDLPFPLCAKVLSADIPHKSDVGAVELDIPTRAALSERMRVMLNRVRRAHPEARIAGSMVQPMTTGLAEVIIGFRRDRDVGAVVMVGVGGTLAELCGAQAALRLAPVSSHDALEMIAAVPALAAIRGYRERPPGDLRALAHAVHRLSLLALIESPAVLDAEINPLIVRTDGVIAVDALVRLASAQ